MTAVNPVLDRAFAPRFFSVYVSIRRGRDHGQPIWVGAGWLRGNPRIGIVLVRPLCDGPGLLFSQVMFCLEELEKQVWGSDNGLNFPESNAKET